MSKRLTDSNKWRDAWFRTLPEKAKLTWLYLCDECDFCGIWKIDFGLASFQLNFNLNAENLSKWFGNKVHFFGNDKLLIVPFYKFQYSESKDSWTAKNKARTKLENLGFNISGNEVILKDSGTTVVDGSQTYQCVSVCECVSECICNFEKESVREKTFNEVICLWNEHCDRLPKVVATNKTRETRSAAIFKKYSPEIITEAIKRLAASDFCNGLNDKSWVADFDFFVRESTYAKIIEGKYDNRKSLSQKQIHEIKKNQELVDWVNDDTKGGGLEF